MMKEEQPAAQSAVPEASPEMNDKEAMDAAAKTPTPTSRRKLYVWAAGGALAVVVVVLCIALPLALRDKGDGTSSSKTTASVNTEGVTDPSATPGTVSTTTVAHPTTTTLSTETSRVVQENYLPLFGSDLINGYEDQDQLEVALRVAFRKQAQTVIDQNIRNYHQQKEWEAQYGQGGGATEAMPPAMSETTDMAMADSNTQNAAPEAGKGQDGGVTDFQTNNQELNVDEADIIKADANFVYAAFADIIAIWDTAGKQVAQVHMPPIDLPQTKPPTTTTTATAKSSIMDPGFYVPKPYINSMLLTDNHLVVVVSGYNSDYSYMINAPPPTPKVLYGYRASQIRLYEKTSSGNLTFVASKDVNGNFVDARSIGSTVHMATSATVDTWSHLDSHLDWWTIANGTEITEVQYQTLATKIADTLVPQVAKALMDELRSDTGELPTLLQINQWFTQVNETATSKGDGFYLPYYQSYNVISNVAQVTSFDVSAALDAKTGELTTSASAYMAPSYFDTLYGTEDFLVLATTGWDWNPALGEGEQTTYLVALEIDGASTKFLSVGSFKGQLLNKYALDVYNGQLRAATTVQRQQWWWWGPRPMAVDVVMTEDAVTLAASTTKGSGRKLQEDPNGLCPEATKDCMNDDNYKLCVELVENGCTEIVTLESCPLQFQCATDQTIIDDPATTPRQDDVEESRTENYMVVLQLVGDNVPAGQMVEKGRVQIGEKNELITSVRFFDNVAYAVTFERTDPFYVLDMSVPKVLGELKIPGFSSYLHSMNPPENTLLLAVGQNATADGMQTGLMVTVFDATVPSAPKALVSHTFENSQDAYSSSSVQWDYKAFRYVDGKLVIPMEIYYQQVWDEAQGWLPLPEGVQNFRGFAVLNVNSTAIDEQYRVSHMKPTGACYYCGAYLPQRSLVYNGDLMTIQDNVVVSTGLHSGTEKWRFTLEVAGEDNGCCA